MSLIDLLDVFILTLGLILPVLSFFFLCRKTIKLLNNPDTRFENNTKIKHLIAALFIPVGFCATAFWGFKLSHPVGGGPMNMGMGPAISALMLSFTIFIYSCGIWISTLSLKWVLGVSACLAIPFFAGEIYYSSWTATSPDLHPIYYSSGMEGVALIYGCLFLLPAFVLLMREINKPT